MDKKADLEQLKKLLTNVYNQGNNGASYQDIMSELTSELPKIIKTIDLAE